MAKAVPSKVWSCLSSVALLWQMTMPLRGGRVGGRNQEEECSSRLNAAIDLSCQCSQVNHDQNVDINTTTKQRNRRQPKAEQVHSMLMVEAAPEPSAETSSNTSRCLLTTFHKLLHVLLHD